MSSSGPVDSAKKKTVESNKPLDSPNPNEQCSKIRNTSEIIKTPNNLTNVNSSALIPEQSVIEEKKKLPVQKGMECAKETSYEKDDKTQVPKEENIEKININEKGKEEESKGIVIKEEIKKNNIMNEEINNEKNKEIENIKGEKKEEVVLSTKILQITIIESPSVTPGTIIRMNQEGIIGSKRNAKDNRAFFGTYEGDNPYQINDYTIPQEEQGFGKRHFMIEYDARLSSYFLKDLGDGTGTFIKIMHKTALNSNMIISFNSVHLAIFFPPDRNKSGTEISINDPLRDVPKEILYNPKSYF